MLYNIIIKEILIFAYCQFGNLIKDTKFDKLVNYAIYR